MPGSPRRQPVRFLVFSASLRRDSLNARLAELAAAAIEAGGGDVDVAAMRDFDAPSYDQDVQRDEGFPPGAEEFRRRLEACHGFVVASPEYNASMPGVLKNAIDWVSRLPNQPFAGKPIALQSASPGPLGGGRVQYDMRRAMVFLDAFTLNKPEIFIGGCASKIDEKTGEIKDEATRGFIKQQLAAFASFVGQVAPKK